MAVWSLGRGCPRSHRPRPPQVPPLSTDPDRCSGPPAALLPATNPLSVCPQQPIRQTRLFHQLRGRGEGEVGGSCWRPREEMAGKAACRHFAWVPPTFPVCHGRGLTWRELCAVRPRPEGAAHVLGGPGLSWAGFLCGERSLGDVWGAEGAGELSQAGSLLPALPSTTPRSTQGSASVFHSKMGVNGPRLPQRWAILGAVLGNPSGPLR